MHRFQYLKVGLSAVLIFIGAKMLLSDFVKIPVEISLGVVASLVGMSVIESLLVGKKKPAMMLPGV